MKKRLYFLLFMLCAVKLFSAEFQNGRIRLVINEDTGRFSLFYLVDLDSDNFEPLLFDQDPRTSFLSVQINDRAFRLGEASAFRVRLGGTTDEPEIIFDSPGIMVMQKFTFIAAGNTPWANGVSVAVYVTNKGDRPVEAGIRMVFDTFLGEDSGTGPSFNTDLRPLTTETLLTSASPDSWWISRNSRYGLMGTLNSIYVLAPDSVHFANWKRFYDTHWNLPFSPRNFSNPPNSFNDAAVSYIFNAATVAPKSFRVVEVLLAAETTDGFAEVSFGVAPVQLARNPPDGSGNMPTREESIRTDMVILRNLRAEIDWYAANGETVPEEKLAEMELIVARVRERYGIF